jgi:hypothetical protein
MVILNDASIHGQFHDTSAFHSSVVKLLCVRAEIERLNQKVYVSRNTLERSATSSLCVRAAVNQWSDRDRKRLFFRWIDKDGPFWERKHSGDDYFEYKHEIVTDTGLAETAWLILEHNETHHTLSVAPSNFAISPLEVWWRGRKGRTDADSSIQNIWKTSHVQATLAALEPEIQSWVALIEWTNRNCPNLILSPETGRHLGATFYPAVAHAAKVQLKILNGIAEKHRTDANGAAIELQEDNRFSDESASNKVAFKNKLTFRNPESGIKTLCGWHGKIRTATFRLHFEWPMRSDKLFVAYIGPKITRD